MNETDTRAAATRRRVLDAAARQFRERGYAGVSLRGIAAAAGIKAGSLYYHFASKEEIVAEVLDIGIALVHDAVAEVIEVLEESTPPETMVKTAVRRHLAAFLDYSDYTSANVRIFGQVPLSVRRANLPARRNYEALWDRLLQQLSARGALRDGLDLRALRQLLLGAMNATLEWFDTERADIDRLADRYADIVLYGVLPRPETT